MLGYIVIASLFSYGAFTVQRPGFVMAFMRGIWKNLPKSLHETFFACGICVASLYGGGCFLYMTYIIPLCELSWQPLAWLPVAMVAASGSNAVLDRAVKAFEKHYNYKPPATEKAEKKWDYLLPYDELRRVIVDNFIQDASVSDGIIVEIGGYHPEWSHGIYIPFNADNPLNQATYNVLKTRLFGKGYMVVILGLGFDGDIRILKDLIQNAATSIIEYSNDGISKQQIDLITEGMDVRMLIPEFTINDPGVVPKACGEVDKRSIILLKTSK